MNLTKEEVVDMLMAISRIDGFLLSVTNSEHVMHDVDIISDTMIDKLNE